jgi:biotin carboxylase
MIADQRTDLGRSLDGRALLEEYLEGPEVSVEGIVEDGEVTVVSVTSKLMGPEPWFAEIGHIVPHDADPAERRAIEAYAEAVCRALGVTLGPFHAEIRLGSGEPVLIEIGARLPGGHIADLVELVTGVSLARAMLAAYTGRPARQLDAYSGPRAKCAAIAVISGRTGTVTAVHGEQAVRAAPDVLDVVIDVRPGDEVVGLEDFRGRLGHVVFTADSHAAALRRWHAIRSEVWCE